MAKLTRKKIASFKGRVAEEALYGEDPIKNITTKLMSDLEMQRAFNWHNYCGDTKKLRKFVEQYAEMKFKKKAAYVKATNDKNITHVMITIARLLLAHATIDCKYIDRLDDSLSKIIFIEESLDNAAKNAVKVIPTTESNTLIADTEDFLDDFYKSDYNLSPVKYFEFLQKKEAKPSDVRAVINYYEPLLEELQEYSEEYLSKPRKKKYVEFVSQILDDCSTYITTNRNLKKTARKPRRKKLKSAEQQTSKVKFKTVDDKLKISSIPPSQLVGASAVWFYNTKYKRLTYLVSDTGMNVKGTTIIGFDSKRSVTKTIRKPEKNLSELLNMSKAGMVKQFLALKTKAAVAKGRLNSDTVILKAIR